MTGTFAPSTGSNTAKPVNGVPVKGRGPWRAARSRKRVPFLALGAVLVFGCVVIFGFTAATLGNRTPVLAVARAVPAGQVITAADLRSVSAATDDGLGLIPASAAGQVVGQTAAVPLVPGALLTKGLVGAAVFPPAGQVTASLALKAGQFPQGIAAGSHVAVYLNQTGPGAATSTGTGSSGPTRLSAVVMAVDPAGDGQGATLITLLLSGSDAARLAATPAAGVVLMATAPDGN